MILELKGGVQMGEESKLYHEMDLKYIKSEIRKIRTTSKSNDEIRRRMVSELSYPFDPTSISFTPVMLNASISNMITFLGPTGRPFQV